MVFIIALFRLDGRVHLAGLFHSSTWGHGPDHPLAADELEATDRRLSAVTRQLPFNLDAVYGSGCAVSHT